MNVNNDFCKLIFITDRKNISLGKYLEFVKICVNAGITSLQLREKNADYNFLLDFGVKLKKLLTPFKIPLIVNDHIDLAIDLDADGVHLGQEDGDPKIARKLLGPDKIIGVSVSSEEQLVVANDLPINYIGVGAIFKTLSKENIANTIGINGLKKIVSKTKHPVVGIGGINEGNVAAAVEAGAHGIAVINAIHSAQNPEKTIKYLRHVVAKTR